MRPISSSFLLYGATLIALLLIYFVVKPVFEYFHDAKRLRQYPNQNFLSGFTYLGQVYERLASFRTANLHEAHKEHPVIRTGPCALSFRDVRAIKDIYSHSEKCVKDDIYPAMAPSHASVLHEADVGEHGRKRRQLAHAFATRNLETWEYKVADKVERLFRQFDKLCDAAKANEDSFAEINWRKWSNLWTVEAIADIGMSHRMGMLESGNDIVVIEDADGMRKEYSFLDSLHRQNWAVSIVVWPAAWYPTLQTLTKWTSSWFRSSWQHSANYGEIIKHMVRVRLARHKKGEKLDDFFHFLMEDRKGSAYDLDPDEIKSEVSTISNASAPLADTVTDGDTVDAGSDTTAIALSHIVYNLLRNPLRLQKLREELNSTLTPDEVIAPYAKLKHLPYLRACLDESLRMAPPLPMGLPRKTPPDGTSILGQWIEGGVTVSVPAYVAHRDPKVFPEPDEYHPERWLDEKGKDMLPSFIPFSTGARGCIGRNISYLEQHVLIASLLRRYNLELVDSEYELPHEEGFVLWTGPLPCRIRRRE